MQKRRKKKNNELVWEGRSIFWPRQYDGRLPGGDSNLWMCAQDAGNELWVHFHRLERISQSNIVEPLQLENCSDELRELLVESLPYKQYRENLGGAITNFSKIIAQSLVIEGRIDFEIKIGWNQKIDPWRMEKVVLKFIPNESLTYLGSQVFQVIPPGAESDGSPGRIIRLDPKRIVTFRTPLQWRRTLARIRNGLPLIGRSERSWMNWMVRHVRNEDINTVKRTYNIQIARLTAPIGWNARSLFRDEIANFHWICRELQWERFCIELRDDILRTLGDAFQRIGQLRGETPRLVWQNLPTVEQVEEGLNQVMSGKTRFDSVLKPFRLE